MAVDLHAEAFPVVAGTRGLVGCRHRDHPLRVGGLALELRAPLALCRAGFETLVIITDGDDDALRAALADDPRIEGRRWRVVAPTSSWVEHLGPDPERWVVLDDEWVVAPAYLGALATTTGPTRAACSPGPFAADAATLRRWASTGWQPTMPPPEPPALTEERPRVLVPVRDAAGARRAREALLDAAIPDRAPWFARHVQRPLSRPITRLLLDTPVTPNQVTLASAAIGLGGAGLIADPAWIAGVVGTLLFLFSTVVDGCDGEIARVKFGETRLGGRLDFAADNVVHFVLFPAIALRFHREGHPEFVALAVAVALGLAVTILAIGAVIVRREPLPWTRALFETFQSREFAWALPVLAVLDRLEAFAWVAAIGVWVFPALLLVTDRLERRGVFR